MMNRNRQKMRGHVFEIVEGGVFKICDEPGSPNEGACLRYMMNWSRPIAGGGGRE